MSSSSSGSIATDKLASLASSTSESVMTMKGFGRLGSSNTEKGGGGRGGGRLVDKGRLLERGV